MNRHDDEIEQAAQRKADELPPLSTEAMRKAAQVMARALNERFSRKPQ